jgi:hypothetical protein
MQYRKMGANSFAIPSAAKSWKKSISDDEKLIIHLPAVSSASRVFFSVLKADTHGKV